MTIELDRDIVEAQLRPMLRKHLAVWVYGNKMGPEALSVELSLMIRETLYDVAATTQRSGPEAGIRAGLNMIKNWER